VPALSVFLLTLQGRNFCGFRSEEDIVHPSAEEFFPRIGVFFPFCFFPVRQYGSAVISHRSRYPLVGLWSTFFNPSLFPTKLARINGVEIKSHFASSLSEARAIMC